MRPTPRRAAVVVHAKNVLNRVPDRGPPGTLDAPSAQALVRDLYIQAAHEKGVRYTPYDWSIAGRCD